MEGDEPPLDATSGEDRLLGMARRRKVQSRGNDLPFTGGGGLQSNGVQLSEGRCGLLSMSGHPSLDGGGRALALLVPGVLSH
eukprot:5609608-Heterocapsa_arctica.AAC.1